MIDAASGSALFPSSQKSVNATTGLIATSPPMNRLGEALNLLSLTGLSEALGDAAWSINEEVETLVDIARTAARPQDRIAAMRHLRTLITDIARLHGAIRTASVSLQHPAGARVAMSGSSVSPQHSAPDQLLQSVNRAAASIEEIPAALESKYVTTETIEDVHGGLARRPVHNARRFDPSATASTPALSSGEGQEPSDLSS